MYLSSLQGQGTSCWPGSSGAPTAGMPGRAGVEASGPEFLVEAGEGSGVDELLAECVVFGLGAIDPVDGVGLSQVGHLFDPANEVLIRGGRGSGGEDSGSGLLGLHRWGITSLRLLSLRHRGGDVNLRRWEAIPPDIEQRGGGGEDEGAEDDAGDSE